MTMKPLETDPDLMRLLEESAAYMDALTPEELEEMLKRQRDRYAQAEMSWPRDCPYR